MRLKGLKRVTVRAGGKTYIYYYHRATGAKLKAEPGSNAFAAEVAELDKQAEERAPRDGSLDALIKSYKKKQEFTDLAPRTQADYNKVFDWLKPIADIGVIEIDTAFVYDLRDKALAQRKRRFANYVVQVIRLLLEWGRPRGFLEGANPAAGVKTISRPKNMKRANRPWSDDEREVVMAEASIELRAMIALGMFAGLREGDACRIPLSAFDGQRIDAVASKNAEPLWIPAHYRLRKILAMAAEERRATLHRRAKRRKVLPIDPPTLVVSSYGTSWTESGFRASFFKLVGRLEREKKVGPDLTFHGLRHTVGKLVIEAGGTKEDVGILLGDRSESMAAFYSREHEKKQLVTATMLKLERVERARLRRKKRGET